MEQIIFRLGDGVRVTQPDPSKLVFNITADENITKQYIVGSPELYDFEGPLRYAFFEEMNAKKVSEASKWLSYQRSRDFRSKTEKNFLTLARLMVTEFRNTYWISKIEPGVGPDGSMRFEPGLEVMHGLEIKEWMQKLREFSVERGSRMSTDRERFLYLAWRASQGLMTIDDIVIGTSKIGNYKKKMYLEKTGARLCANAFDGIGNSIQLCKHDFGHVLLGGMYNEDGMFFPPAAVRNDGFQKEHFMYAAACCTLTQS